MLPRSKQKMLGYQLVPRNNIRLFLRALSHQPLACAIRVSKDFNNYDGKGIFMKKFKSKALNRKINREVQCRVPPNAPRNVRLSVRQEVQHEELLKMLNHSVLAVGYGGRGKGRFIRILNSWGKGWGRNGIMDIGINVAKGYGLFVRAFFPIFDNQMVRQKLKEAGITKLGSLLFMRNLLRSVIFKIIQFRDIFPKKYFIHTSIPILERKVILLTPVDAESRRLIDWMEKGVFDALQKRYLKTLSFCICESAEGPTIEEYSFTFNYSSGEAEKVSIDMTRSKKQGCRFKPNRKEITQNDLRSSACKMNQNLVRLMKTLDCMPNERTVLMKLFYYDDANAKPLDYEPPFFRGCSEQDATTRWAKNPLKREVGNVNSKHILLALEVKSVLDPCKDVNAASEDGSVSLGRDSVQNGYSSDSKVNLFQEDDDVDSDDDIRPDKDKEELATRERDFMGLINVFSDFPSISTKLMPDVDHVREEMDAVERTKRDTTSRKREDRHLYMEALYHAESLEYVTIATLQKKFKGKISIHTVRKLINKMALDGFLEAKSSGKLGKRVIHSAAADRKFEEVKRALDMEMKVDNNLLTRPSLMRFPSSPGCKDNEESICGGLHSNCNKGENPAKSTPLSKMQISMAVVSLSSAIVAFIC